MMSRTHIPVGIASALAVAPPHAQLTQLAIYAVAGGLGAVLPDIDSHRSLIGRKLKIISDVIEHIAGHRKLFHSLIGEAGLFGLAYILLRLSYPLYLILLLPLLVGYLSHLVLDTVAGGTPWLYPFVKDRFGLHFETNGIMEKWFFRPAAVIIMLFVVYHSLSLMGGAGR